MNSKDIGNLGEHIAIVELLKLNVRVSRPLGDNARYDLILEIGGILYTAQVKSTLVNKEDLVEFPLQSSQAHRGGSKQHYDVDMFILVDIPKNQVYLYFNLDRKTSVKLRYNYSEDIKYRASTWAKDHLLEKVICSLS